ncbi:hypothetical protein GW17_00047096 [Ensete ventricosum]|nr:hypothetical protein GW17_00047096 [Ensete ventricosum]
MVKVKVLTSSIFRTNTYHNRTCLRHICFTTIRLQPNDLNRRSGARLSARARQGEARAPRSNPKWRSKRCRLEARPSPGVGRFGRAPGLIQATEPGFYLWFGRSR